MNAHLVLGFGLPLVIAVLAGVIVAGMELQRRWNLHRRERMK